MRKKNLIILIFIMIHLAATRFAVRIVDATVQIDGNYITLIALIIALNLGLYLVLRKIYRMMMQKR